MHEHEIGYDKLYVVSRFPDLFIGYLDRIENYTDRIKYAYFKEKDTEKYFVLPFLNVIYVTEISLLEAELL